MRFSYGRSASWEEIPRQPRGATERTARGHQLVLYSGHQTGPVDTGLFLLEPNTQGAEQNGTVILRKSW